MRFGEMKSMGEAGLDTFSTACRIRVDFTTDVGSLAKDNNYLVLGYAIWIDRLTKRLEYQRLINAVARIKSSYDEPLMPCSVHNFTTVEIISGEQLPSMMTNVGFTLLIIPMAYRHF